MLLKVGSLNEGKKVFKVWFCEHNIIVRDFDSQNHLG